MNRDLLFFLAGLVFGIVVGYFVFRAFVPAAATSSISTTSTLPPPSQIGLGSKPDLVPLDDEEVSQLEKSIQQNLEDDAPRARLGGLFLGAGHYKEAADLLSSAIDLDPNNLKARNQLALAYLNMGNLDDAVTTYEKTLRFKPNHPNSLLGLGRLKLYLQKDIEGGVAMWKLLVATAPDSVEAKSVREELEALMAAHPEG